MNPADWKAIADSPAPRRRPARPQPPSAGIVGPILFALMIVGGSLILIVAGGILSLFFGGVASGFRGLTAPKLRQES